MMDADMDDAAINDMVRRIIFSTYDSDNNKVHGLSGLVMALFKPIYSRLDAIERKIDGLREALEKSNETPHLDDLKKVVDRLQSEWQMYG